MQRSLNKAREFEEHFNSQIFCQKLGFVRVKKHLIVWARLCGP